MPVPLSRVPWRVRIVDKLSFVEFGFRWLLSRGLIFLRLRQRAHPPPLLILAKDVWAKHHPWMNDPRKPVFPYPRQQDFKAQDSPLACLDRLLYWAHLGNDIEFRNDTEYFWGRGWFEDVDHEVWEVSRMPDPRGVLPICDDSANYALAGAIVAGLAEGFTEMIFNMNVARGTWIFGDGEGLHIRAETAPEWTARTPRLWFTYRLLGVIDRGIGPISPTLRRWNILGEKLSFV